MADRGIKCGACKGRHQTVEDVATCYYEMRQEEAEARAEQAAELGYERWLEDAGSRLDPAGYEHDRMMEAFDPQFA